MARQCDYARLRLSELLKERHEASQQGNAPQKREHRHCEHELAYLQDMLREEERLLEEARRTNAQLEQSCKSIQAECDDLQHQRTIILSQATSEAEKLRSDTSPATASSASNAFRRDPLSSRPSSAKPSSAKADGFVRAEVPASFDAFDGGMAGPQMGSWATSLVGGGIGLGILAADGGAHTNASGHRDLPSFFAPGSPPGSDGALSCATVGRIPLHAQAQRAHDREGV